MNMPTVHAWRAPSPRLFVVLVATMAGSIAAALRFALVPDDLWCNVATVAVLANLCVMTVIVFRMRGQVALRLLVSSVLLTAVLWVGWKLYEFYTVGV